MFKPLGLYIGLRYTRAKRRNHFISFISIISMLGVAVGVTALITVISVMNGFEKELRGRILGVTAHATIVERGRPLRDWRAVSKVIDRDPRVRGSAPFIRAEGMATRAGSVHGVIVEGVLPDQEPKVSVVGERMRAGRLADLKAGGYNILLGAALARELRAEVGDKITLVVPQAMATPAGILPRLKRFTLAGVFEIGMHDYDAALAVVHLEDAARLFRIQEGVSGIRIKVDDMFAAPRISRDLIRGLPEHYAAVDWTQQHVNFFHALKTEKIVMYVILMLIVAVAAFNIISTLVMVVTDKAADVAILRTLGLTPRGIMSIFIVQGTVIGFVGTLLGLLGGVQLATHVDTLVPAIEQLFQTQFLPPDIYYISELPSDMRWPDVIRITVIAFTLCLLSTLYPAWRASRTQPAEVLRYE
ncbi:MAG: lipoprotein-releasing ABC transporter permease subunit [Gammaproteobacteria bacterium]|nr:lipoprotein-releasing ABC transporter permease subunit [Gammaproteobacteria bacterium]